MDGRGVVGSPAGGGGRGFGGPSHGTAQPSPPSAPTCCSSRTPCAMPPRPRRAPAAPRRGGAGSACERSRCGRPSRSCRGGRTAGSGSSCGPRSVKRKEGGVFERAFEFVRQGRRVWRKAPSLQAAAQTLGPRPRLTAGQTMHPCSQPTPRPTQCIHSPATWRSCGARTCEWRHARRPSRETPAGPTHVDGSGDLAIKQLGHLQAVVVARTCTGGLLQHDRVLRGWGPRWPPSRPSGVAALPPSLTHPHPAAPSAGICALRPTPQPRPPASLTCPLRTSPPPTCRCSPPGPHLAAHVAHLLGVQVVALETPVRVPRLGLL